LLKGARQGIAAVHSLEAPWLPFEHVQILLNMFKIRSSKAFLLSKTFKLRGLLSLKLGGI
jgi:hypothetical protein